MMKDRGCIDAVIREQKTKRSERNYRVFQAMRLVRHEYIKMIQPDLNCSEEYQDMELLGLVSDKKSRKSCDSVKLPEVSQKRLKDVTVKHILDNFRKIGRPSYGRLSTTSNSTQRFSSHEHAHWAV